MKGVFVALIASLFATVLTGHASSDRAYILVDQSITESKEAAETAADCLAEELLKSGIAEVKVLLLPAEETRIVAVSQDEDRTPDFSRMSDIVASPHETCIQLRELLDAVSRNSDIYKMGREDAAWNEISLISENREYLNEVPVEICPEGEACFTASGYYISEDETLSQKHELDETIMERDLRMHWISNKPAAPLGGYQAALHAEELVDALPLPAPGEHLSEEEMAEIEADPVGHMATSARDDHSIGTYLSSIGRMAAVGGALAAVATGQPWLAVGILLSAGILGPGLEMIDVFVESTPYGVSHAEWVEFRGVIEESLGDGRIASLTTNLPIRSSAPSNRMVGDPFELGERGIRHLLREDALEDPRLNVVHERSDGDALPEAIGEWNRKHGDAVRAAHAAARGWMTPDSVGPYLPDIAASFSMPDLLDLELLSFRTSAFALQGRPSNRAPVAATPRMAWPVSLSMADAQCRTYPEEWKDPGIEFSDPDGDPLRFYLLRSPRKGTANLMTGGEGGEYAVTVLYKIDRNDALEAHRTRGKTPYIDRFTVVAEDPFGARAQTQVEVTVDVINSDPICVNDEATTPMGTPVEIDVLANDSDVDEDELSVVFVSTPGVGASSVSHMMIRYEPLPVFYGEDSFVYTAADGYGGETDATVTVHVVDTEPPVFVNGPGDIGPLLNDLGVCGAAVTWTEPVVNVDVTDNVGIASLLSSHTPGSVLPVGETTVTHTATDPSGNTARWTFTVTIEDDEPPMIDGMPSDMCVAAAEGETEAVVTWSPPTTSDNCGVADLTSSHAPGDVFPLGDTPVTYAVEDVHGHASARAFTVTVVRTWLLACADVEVSTSNPSGTTVTFANPVVGGCGVSATCTPTSGSTFPIGTTLVTCQATDGVRTETCSFRVTVELSNRPPNARNDMVQMGDHQISIEIDVLANDSDPDGDRLNLVGVGSPSPCGDAWIAPCGDSVRFLATYCLPYLGGQATFSYTISDIHGETDAAAVTIGLPDSGTMPECAPPPGGDR